jgi:radical SAM family uncharacterized protein/radical SAM-linked protein
MTTLSKDARRANVAIALQDDLLPRVEKPSRYLGNEVNSTRKDPATVDVRLALCFPDLYDLGLGNLGIHILYTALNRLPWASCERVYAPGLDLEALLRDRGLPLFALESKDGLAQFDGIGFTLQSELTWTNILNILDLSGIPLRATDRGEDDPLTFAGGPAVFNPEPLAPFMDFFVIGDGEDAILEIAEVLRATRGQAREARLRAIGALEGVYVPAHYPMEVLDDGRVLPPVDGPKIRKRLTRDLNGATFPTEYIVPFTHQVHDRVSLEVLRGCTQGCRFCQAGMVTRPVRERKLERVDELLRRTLASTGYEEVSLVSLSTCDHSRVRQLVENTVEALRDAHVAVSLPSLRLDSFSVDLADMVADVRRTGLTFAPEAASPRLRAVINKWIPDEDLLEMADRAFSLQWSHVKLYFMIGLPTERDDDILAIADLAKRALWQGKKYSKKARINLGVSTFVPKPFTPFQWAPQIDAAETERRQRMLASALDHHDLKFGRHHPEETFLEGLLSRTDRRAADLVEAAFRLGCRFDAWSEHLDFEKWQAAIAETGFDVQDALRARDLDERLPWDHIDVLIPKSWFAEDYRRALELQHAQDCRHKRCHKCGVIDAERALCAAMLRDNVEGRKTEAAWVRKPRPEGEVSVEPAVQRLLFRFSRTGQSRFLSHLETMNALVRALRRAGAPLAYSEGFHPHPKVAFSTALPVGEESLGEYMDVELAREIDGGALRIALAATMPEGFEILDVTEAALKGTSLMALNQGGVYRLALPHEAIEAVTARVAAINDAPTIVVQRRSKRKDRRGREEVFFVDVDARPMIRELRVEAGNIPVVHATLVTVDGKPGKPGELLRMLTDQPERGRVVKVDTLKKDGAGWASLSADWTPPPLRDAKPAGLFGGPLPGATGDASSLPA